MTVVMFTTAGVTRLATSVKPGAGETTAPAGVPCDRAVDASDGVSEWPAQNNAPLTRPIPRIELTVRRGCDGMIPSFITLRITCSRLSELISAQPVVRDRVLELPTGDEKEINRGLNVAKLAKSKAAAQP